MVSVTPVSTYSVPRPDFFVDNISHVLHPLYFMCLFIIIHYSRGILHGVNSSLFSKFSLDIPSVGLKCGLRIGVFYYNLEILLMTP